MTKHMALLLASALAVRLLGLSASPLWFDEAISQYRAAMPITQYLIDMSDYVGPNLWELVLRPFAHGPAWLFRVPSLVVSLVALWIAWRLAERLQFTHVQQITAAIPMLLLPGMVWMAQDARYYGALSMLYLAALYFAVTWRTLGLVACVGLMAYLHPVGAFFGVAAILVAWIRGMPFRRIILISTAVMLAWIPAIYRLVYPAHPRPAFWLGELSPVYVAEQTAQAFAVGTLSSGWALLLLVLLAPAAIAGIIQIRRRRVRMLLVAALAPIILMLAASLVQPIYFYRPAQAAMVPCLLLFGRTLAPGRAWWSKIAPALGAAVLVVGMLQWDPSARGSHIDNGAAFVAQHWHSGDRITYAAATVAVPFSRYLPGRDACLLADNGLDFLPSNLLMPYCDAGDLGPWLVWPREEKMRPEIKALLAARTAGRMPVWQSGSGWQWAPIEIYYLHQ